MSGRDKGLAEVFAHIGNIDTDDKDLIFTDVGEGDESESSHKRAKVSTNPINILRKIVDAANKKPSLKKKLTAEKIKENARKLFLQYLEEFYAPSFDESKF